MLVGASIGADDIEFYEPLIPGNDIMRIFPVRATIGGAELRVLPPWSDARLAYCRRRNTIPFLSCKIDGNAGGLEHVRQQLEDLPAWIRDDQDMQVFITDRHEPEGDLDGGPAAYKRNYTRFHAMIDNLPPRIRGKIRSGPILTQYWNEHKGNNQYQTYDPGIGDFLGIDAYVSAGTRENVMIPADVPPPAEFLKHIKPYAYNPSDARPRLFPELGLIGMPADKDGSARAAWIQHLHDELSTWHAGAPGWHQPWNFIGWIWWNQQGKNTGDVDVIGGRRDFALDDRTVDKHTVVKLRPPKPMQTFNAIWKAEHRSPHLAEALVTGPGA